MVQSNQLSTDFNSIRFRSKQEIKKNWSYYYIKACWGMLCTLCHLWCDCRNTVLVLLAPSQLWHLAPYEQLHTGDDLRLIWPRGEDALPDIHRSPPPFQYTSIRLGQLAKLAAPLSPNLTKAKAWGRSAWGLLNSVFDRSWLTRDKVKTNQTDSRICFLLVVHTTVG